MAIQPRNTIKSWFLRGLKPLAAQFSDWLDSFVHKDDMIAMNKITGLETALSDTASMEEIEGKYRDQVELEDEDGNYILNAGTIITHIEVDTDTDLPAFKIIDDADDEILFESDAEDPITEDTEPIALTIYARAERTIRFEGIEGTGAEVKIIILKSSI